MSDNQFSSSLFSVPNSCPTSPSGRLHSYPYGLGLGGRLLPHDNIRVVSAGRAAPPGGAPISSAPTLTVEEVLDSSGPDKPDLNNVAHNAVVYPSEDGQHLSPVPPAPVSAPVLPPPGATHIIAPGGGGAAPVQIQVSSSNAIRIRQL